MNYLAEIKAFEQWIETHYLPCSSQLIWYRLMNLNNNAGWCEWISVENRRLMAAVQMKREATFIEARDKLIEAGLITYRKGRKGIPNSYHMVSLIEKNTFKNEVETVVKTEVKSVVKPEVKTANINKQNKTKHITPKPPVGAKQQKSNLDQYNSFMKSEFDFDDLEKRLTGN